MVVWSQPSGRRSSSVPCSSAGERDGARGELCSLPFGVLPPSICATAPPRPMVGIVPSLRHLKGLGSLSSSHRAMRLRTCSRDCSATEPGSGRVCCVFPSLIASISPTTYTSGLGAREIRTDGDAVA